MKHKIAYYTFVPVLALSLLGIRAASAHGSGFGMRTPEEISARGQSMFDHQAQMLGISVDEVKDAWSQGKTMHDIVKEKKISKTDIEARMKTAHTDQLKAQLEALVDKGVITQAQADTRLTSMQARMEEAGNGKGRMKGFLFSRR